MKQALIFSDSHSRLEKVIEIVKKYPKVEAIFHCGDIESGDDRLRQLISGPVAIVRGNCDYNPKLPEEIVTSFAGKKIAMCHGHRQYMYGGVDMLKYWAMEKEADIVLFGHTHVPFLEQGSNLVILNPGSITKPRQEGHRASYAVLEVDDRGQIMVEIKYV